MTEDNDAKVTSLGSPDNAVTAWFGSLKSPAAQESGIVDRFCRALIAIGWLASSLSLAAIGKGSSVSEVLMMGAATVAILSGPLWLLAWIISGRTPYEMGVRRG